MKPCQPKSMGLYKQGLINDCCRQSPAVLGFLGPAPPLPWCWEQLPPLS